MPTDSRPHVLHLRVVAGTGGGPEKTILNSPRFIRNEGIEASVAYLCPPRDSIGESLRTRASEADCPLHVLEDRGPLDLSLIFRVVKLCRNLKVDILQTHDYKSNALAWFVRKFYRVRLVTMLHGWTDLSGRMPLYKRIDQLVLPLFESLICVSPDLIEECKRLRIAEDRLHLVHNAIDTTHFRRQYETRTAKEKLQANPDRFLIGSVGRLSKEKGFDRLIQAVAELQQQGFPVDLWIAGDGPERSRLSDTIDRYGCQKSIRLLGQLTDLRLLYQAMDLFVLNSTREGLPNVLLEAMALQTPAIATQVGGISDLITPGKTGLLIALENDGQLSEAIRIVFNNPAYLQDMATAARQHIEGNFSFDVRMKKIAHIYRTLLHSPPL